MGVEYSAKIVVGLPVDEMHDLRDDEGYWDAEGVLEFVPDSYDSQDGVVGIVIAQSGDYSYSEFDPSWLLGMATDRLEAFKQTTGKTGKVYISTCGY